MRHAELKDIITPILTPMNSDKSVHLDELRNQISRLLEDGVHDLFLFGTDGEGYILSENEKTGVLEATIDQVEGRIPVYTGNGCISTVDTVRISKKAQELGADVLSVITPSFALASQKKLYDYYMEVTEYMGIPIALYNILTRTGNKLLPETVAKLTKDVDIIMSAEGSSDDWDNLLAYITLMKELGKDFRILSGDDSLILSCLKAGGADGIAGCTNVYPHVLASIYDLFQASKLEEAGAVQDPIASFRTVFKYDSPSTVIKKAVSLLGYPIGDYRRPFNYLCDEDIEALKLVLKENADESMR